MCIRDSPESDLPKIKTVFWHNNIIGFAPTLETSILVSAYPLPVNQFPTIHADGKLIGTWASHPVRLPDGTEYPTGCLLYTSASSLHLAQ